MQPKYRAWYKNKMWKVETMFVADIDKGFTRIRLSRVENGKYEWEFPFGNDLELLQFVGLDKNGKEMYTGDVVAYKYMGVLVEEEIVYNKERAGHEPFIGVMRSPDWINVQMDHVEVVGNRFNKAKIAAQ